MFPLLAAQHVAADPSGNLVANGGFETPGVEKSPAGWVLKSWQGEQLASGKVTAGGRFDRNCLRLTSTSVGALYGCYTQPIEISKYAGQTVLFDLYCRTAGAPQAHALLLTFARDFTESELETPALSRDCCPLPDSNQWTLVSRRIEIPVTAHHLVIIVRIAGQGDLCVDGVSLRSTPAEISCNVASAGLVIEPSKRTTRLALANNTGRRINGRIRLEASEQGRVRASALKPLQLAAGETEQLEIPYACDFRRAHDLRVTVLGERDDEVYDDATLAIPCLVDANIRVPAFRTTIISDVPGEEVVVSGHVHAVPELVRQTQVSACIIGTGKPAGQDQRITLDGAGQFTVHLPTGGLVSNDYLVRLQATLKTWQMQVDLPFTKAPPRPNQVAHDEYGLLWAGGMPTFPIGMAYVLEAGDLPAISRAGFSFIIAPSRMASWSFMDHATANRLGVFISSASVETDFWSNMAQKYGPRANFWGWYILEKPDTQASAVPPELLQDLYADLRRLDPARPVLCLLSSASAFQTYRTASDIPLAYIEPRPPGQLSDVARLVGEACAIVPPQKPVWALLPIAGAAHIRDRRLDPSADGRPPTPNEYRAMAYLCLLSGARGIVCYAYRIPGDNQRLDYVITRDAPQLWEQVTAVNQELSVVGPMLLKGQRRARHSAPQDPVQWAVWEYGEQAIVVLVNTTAQQQIGAFVADHLTQPVLQSLTGPHRLEGTSAAHFATPLAPYETAVYVGGLQ